jgi:predicted neutral ceramidase superfamily lipid hydrolase
MVKMYCQECPKHFCFMLKQINNVSRLHILITCKTTVMCAFIILFNAFIYIILVIHLFIIIIKISHLQMIVCVVLTSTLRTTLFPLKPEEKKRKSVVIFLFLSLQRSYVDSPAYLVDEDFEYSFLHYLRHQRVLRMNTDY